MLPLPTQSPQGNPLGMTGRQELMGQPGGFQFAPGRRMDQQQDVTPQRMQPLGSPQQFGMPAQQAPSPSQFMPMMQPPPMDGGQAAQDALDSRLEMFDVAPRQQQQGFSPQQQEMIMEGARNVRLPMDVENAYSAATEGLRKAAMNVANDPRFSPEQRQEAFQRIQSRMDEMRQNYVLGKDLMTSPTGYDIPPEEVFGELQPGLMPLSGGRLRNPETGDVLATAIAPNGQVVPVARTQSEIDALPDGTSYMDPTGKVQVAKAAGGKTSSTSATRQVGGAQQFETPEDALKAYETWNRRRPPNSPEELEIINGVIATLPDEQRQVIEANLQDAESIQDVMGILGPSAPPNLAQQLRSASISAFSREQNERQQISSELAGGLGIEIPEERVPLINPQRYLVQTGSRGTTRVTRRGSQFAVPAIQDDTGELIIAPQASRDLGEIEVDTPFQNIREVDGKQVRMLPFDSSKVNLGDFSLSDAQRKALAKSTGGIAPRTKENWDQFQNELLKFQVNGVEPWDPRNPTEAQGRLQQMVGNYYSELDTPSKAAMTMMIAHSLGYQVNPRTNYSTTGWATKQFGGAVDASNAPARPAIQSPYLDQRGGIRTFRSTEEARNQELESASARAKATRERGRLENEQFMRDLRDGMPRGLASEPAPRPPIPPEFEAAEAERMRLRTPEKSGAASAAERARERLARPAQQPTQPAQRLTEPESPGIIDRISAATGSMPMREKIKTRNQYDSLVSEYQKALEMARKNPQDVALNRDAVQAKRDIDEFISKLNSSRK